MRLLLLTALLCGCATGDWADYNYGPADWLNDNTVLSSETMYNYRHFINPTIELHYVSSVATPCGTAWVQACSILRGDHCDIYVRQFASPGTIAHEQRHCRGWSHYAPQYEMFSAMGAEFRAAEIARASSWFPLDDASTGIALALPVSSDRQ